MRAQEEGITKVNEKQNCRCRATEPNLDGKLQRKFVETVKKSRAHLRKQKLFSGQRQTGRNSHAYAPMCQRPKTEKIGFSWLYLAVFRASTAVAPTESAANWMYESVWGKQTAWRPSIKGQSTWSLPGDKGQTLGRYGLGRFLLLISFLLLKITTLRNYFIDQQIEKLFCFQKACRMPITILRFIRTLPERSYSNVGNQLFRDRNVIIRIR